jgi:hypothetical protein
VVEEPGTRACSSDGNREVSRSAATLFGLTVRGGKARSHSRRCTNWSSQTLPVVAGKSPNKAGSPVAEAAEPRASPAGGPNHAVGRIMAERIRVLLGQCDIESKYLTMSISTSDPKAGGPRGVAGPLFAEASCEERLLALNAQRHQRHDREDLRHKHLP